jgi:hypothetical protein
MAMITSVILQLYTLDTRHPHITHNCEYLVWSSIYRYVYSENWEFSHIWALHCMLGSMLGEN